MNLSKVLSTALGAYEVLVNELPSLFHSSVLLECELQGPGTQQLLINTHQMPCVPASSIRVSVPFPGLQSLRAGLPVILSGIAQSGGSWRQ